MDRFWDRRAVRAVLCVLLGPSPRHPCLGDYGHAVARANRTDPQRATLPTTAVGIRSGAAVGIGLFGPRIIRAAGTPGVSGLRHRISTPQRIPVSGYDCDWHGRGPAPFGNPQPTGRLAAPFHFEPPCRGLDSGPGHYQSRFDACHSFTDPSPV